MKTANRGNALLVELLIVVIFFMLASTVLLQVFTESRNQGQKAGIINEALVAAQNVADRLYASQGGPDETAGELKRMGFDFDAAGGSFLEKEDYRLLVSRNTEDREAGLMDVYQVQAYQKEQLLFTLLVERYREAQP